MNRSLSNQTRFILREENKGYNCAKLIMRSPLTEMNRTESFLLSRSSMKAAAGQIARFMVGHPVLTKQLSQGFQVIQCRFNDKIHMLDCSDGFSGFIHMS